MGKILDLLFLFISITSSFCINFLNLNRKISRKGIAAFPYYSEGLPGGHERIGSWKPYFENEGINFDIYWASNKKEYEEFLKTKSVIKKYSFHFKVLLRRIKTLSTLSNYSTIWIQRSYIPFYPYKNSYFECALSKYHENIVIDYYDADYVHNPKLINESVKNSNTVTVATPFLLEYFSKINPSTKHIRMTINKKKYILKKDYKVNDPIKIGWMGSPENAKHILHIENVLSKIEKEFKVVFHVVCRDFPSNNLKKIKVSKWGDNNFNYHDWISSLDIGIVPYIGNSERLKAKPAMKTLEFMASGIPVVSSKWGAFDKMRNEHDFLLANDDKDWYETIMNLIKEINLRIKIGKNGRSTFEKYHTHESIYPKLKKILLN